MLPQSQCVLFAIQFVFILCQGDSQTGVIEDLIDRLDELSAEVQSLKSAQKELSTQFNISNCNAVPIGFIYFHVPLQAGPQLLWPCVQWEDITSEYAGYFFRALGGGSDLFGARQAENAPRLTSVSSVLITANGNEVKHVNVPIGGTSGRLWTGDDVGGMKSLLATSFTNSGGEVRPKNMAVKIWRRKS